MGGLFSVHLFILLFLEGEFCDGVWRSMQGSPRVLKPLCESYFRFIIFKSVDWENLFSLMEDFVVSDLVSQHLSRAETVAVVTGFR